MQGHQLAAYAYHNCEFDHAISLAKKETSLEAAILVIKALCELDRANDAVAESERTVKDFPEAPEAYYYRGMAYYLGKHSKAAIEQSFLQASRNGYVGGALGLAFIAYSDGRYEEGLALAQSARPRDPELSHIHMLFVCQIATAAGDFAAAERCLKASDHNLAMHPSLLRHFWGQICWARFLRTSGRFDGALALTERMIEQLDPQKMPRLYRNAKDTLDQLQAKSDDQGIILPDGESCLLRAQMATITRKPMLNSLFQYLCSQSRQGASKEEITESVWEEKYNPLIHDDRIYKAVGRLRKLLGDDLRTPTILVQKGKNYVLQLDAGSIRGEER